MLKHVKLLVVVVLINVQSCVSQTDKINGVSFVAANAHVSQTHIEPLVNVGANYAAIMPFGFIRDLNHPEILFNTHRQWFGETVEGATQYINELRKRDIKIMLKPQIWVRRGEYTGFIEMTTETNWNILEDTYTKFILEYAALAQEIHVDIFCIGTELERFITHREFYWLDLIKKIKTVYKGKLTYAANWDEFKRTPFWDTLDYIGIDAYFPVSDSKTPVFEECMERWKTHKNTIQEVSGKFNKPILFTEYGYRSVDYTGKEPWNSNRSMSSVNLEAQNITTKALFETFWKEPWFAGGFLWKWFIHHDEVGGANNAMFTPQNKPVEQIVKHYYNLN